MWTGKSGFSRICILFSKHARLRKRDIDSDHLPSVNLIFDFVKIKPCRDRAENNFLSVPHDSASGICVRDLHVDITEKFLLS